MIYTEMTRKAVLTAFRAHEGQKDRSGLPYVLHPVHLAEQMTTEDACVVALLHDILEDTDMTLSDLKAEGFTEEQLEAVRLLTHEEGVDYLDYVRQLKENPLARTVKLADLAHNMDRTRLPVWTEKDERRYHKYENAFRILTEGE